MRVPPVAHYGYGSWRNEALRAQADCRKIPDPAPAEIRRGLGELDRLLAADELERKKLEERREEERQEEERRERRQAGRGMSL